MLTILVVMVMTFIIKVEGFRASAMSRLALPMENDMWALSSRFSWGFRVSGSGLRVQGLEYSLNARTIRNDIPWSALVLTYPETPFNLPGLCNPF